MRKNLLLTGGLISVLLSGVVHAQSIEQRLDRLERIADNPVLIQHAQRIEQQQREIQSLHDRLDRQDRLIAELEKLLNQFESSINQRLITLEKRDSAQLSSEASGQLIDDVSSSKLGQADSGEALLQQNGANTEEAQTASSERARYDVAFDALRDSRFDEAVDLFSAYIGDYPSAGLTSDAIYWLGESYMMKQSFLQAYDTFNKLIENYSTSSKLPDAMLRAADSLVGMEKMTEAQKMYQKLIALLPESRSAKTAERRLERFN